MSGQSNEPTESSVLADLKWLADLMKSEGLTELEVESGGLYARLVAEKRPAPVVKATVADQIPPHWVPVRAPFPCVFWRARRAQDNPLVEEGDQVSLGEALAIMEVVKTFSDLESPVKGVVVRLVAQNGQTVKENDILLYLEPS